MPDAEAVERDERDDYDADDKGTEPDFRRYGVQFRDIENCADHGEDQICGSNPGPLSEMLEVDLPGFTHAP